MLIFINRFFHPDHSATAQMLSGIAFGLARQGHPVAVITSRLRYEGGGEALPALEEIDGVRIVRVWTTRFGRRNLVLRAIDYLTFYLMAVIAVLREARRGDVVIAKTDPPMLSVVMGPAARLKGAVAVNWLQDLFPEVAEAVAPARGRVARYGYGALRWLRDRSLRRAQLNIAIGQGMAARLQRGGVAAERITVIANWQDENLVRPVVAEGNALRTEWGLGQAFVVGYSGNLGLAHDYRTFGDAMARIGAAAGANLQWLFIGGGAGMDALARDVTRLGLTNVQFRPYQPAQRLAESLGVADVHLISLKPSMEGLIVPSKFYGVAAAGRSTIFVGALDGEIAGLLGEHRCGLAVREGDVDGLAAAVIERSRDVAETAAMGARARALFEARYTLETAIARWDAAMKRLQR